MSRPSRLPLRVAVVQMHAHLAFEDDGKLYLGEPLGRPLDRPLLTRLDDRLTPNSPAQRHLAQLRRHIASAYDRGLLARLKAILAFCAGHKADLVVFPEYSIPGSLVPALRDEAHRLGLAIVAGTHLVTTELLDHPPYAEAFDTSPAPGQAIAPVIIPGDDSKVRYQPKLFPSQWETSLDGGEGPVIFDWKERHLAFGVAICIDFLRHRDPEGAAAHAKWRDDTNLLIVPSATPKDTPQQFASSADHFYRATHTPVIYSNLAEYGGTGVAGYGKPDGRVLAVGSKIPNLSGGHEGITIVHLDLHNTTDTTPRRYDADTPIRLIAYALILHAESHPALAEVARQLLTASDARTFKQLCHDHEHTLATAARELRDVPLVSARWTSLAKFAQGIHNLDDLQLRATDLWLSDDVPSIPQIEQALAQATIQALRGISADPTSTTEDRAALQDTIDALDKALRDPPIPPTPDPPPPNIRGILEEVLRFRTPDAPPLPPVPINPDGTLDPWVADPGPPPQHLTAQGFLLQDRASLGDSGLRFDLEPAATWLALQDSPPSWLGTSPNGTPALVVAPGHVVLVSHVIPPEADLRLARPTASKPLPIALLTGSSDGLSIPLPPDVLPLDRAIRHLALDRDHLNELANYQYSDEYARFIEPSLSVGKSTQPALATLTAWLHHESTSAVLCGAIGDGRTTLLRAWLIGIARDALLRDALPVRYIDATDWRAHDHISALLRDLAPKQRAALRLAITTGNCLLVLDGIDDIFPKHLTDHPRVSKWLDSPSQARLLQASCWPESPSFLFHIQPGHDSLSIGHAAGIADVTAKLEATLRHIIADQPIPSVNTHDPAALLDDLALALWSATPAASSDHPWCIAETALRRQRSARRPHGSEPDPALSHIPRMRQRVLAIDRTPLKGSSTDVWKWHARHAAIRAPIPPGIAQYTKETTWITLAWDNLLHHLLSRQIIRALLAGETEPLDILPIHPTTVEYCRIHPDWPRAWPQLAGILTGPPAQNISVNALLLAIKVPGLASTSENPWRLDGLDLRALDLTSAKLDHARLTRALLAHSQLASASLRDADLTEARLDSCDLTDTDLTGVHARGASFAGARVEGTILHSADLQDADLSRTFFLGHPPDCSSARFAGAKFYAVDWPSNPPSTEQQSGSIWRWSTKPILADQIEECLRTPILPQACFAWSPDGHWVAAGDYAGTLWLWSSGPTVRPLALIRAHSGQLRSIAFSPDGTTLATVGSDQRVCLWRSEDLAATHEHLLPTTVSGLFWENNLRLWIFGAENFLWNLSGDDPPSPQHWIESADAGAITHDGRYLVTVKHQGNRAFVVYDLAARSIVASHSSTSGWISSVDLDQNRLVVDDHGFYIRSLVETAGGSRLFAPQDRARRHLHLHSRLPTESWSRNGKRLVLLVDEGACFAFDTQSLARQALNVPLHGSSILVTADGERLLLATGATFETMHIGLDDRSTPVHPSIASTWHDDFEWTNSVLRLRGNKLDLRLDLATGSIVLQTYDPPTSKHRSSSPDGLRSIDEDGDGFSIWDSTTQRRTLLAPSPLYNGSFNSIPFVFWSPDAQTVAVQRATDADSTQCTIWNTNTGRQIFHGDLPGAGSIVLVTKEGVTPLCDRDRGAWLHLLDLDRGARLAVKTSPNEHLGRVNASRGLRYLAFTMQSTQVVQFNALLGVLTSVPDQTSQTCPLDALSESVLTLSAPPSGNSGVALDETLGRVAVINDNTLRVHDIQDGALLTELALESNTYSLAFSPNGEHVVIHYADHLQFWNLRTRALVARIYALRDGALIIANGRFQRILAEQAATPPSLVGFYARAGVHLHPLDRLAHLESTTLCADLWNTLSGTPQE